MRGDDGNDQLVGGDGQDEVYGGDGNDWIWGGNDDDNLFGDNGADLIWGEAGDDYLTGGEGQDMLVGGNGSDHLLAVDKSYMDTVIGGNSAQEAPNDDIDVAYIDKVFGKWGALFFDSRIGIEEVYVFNATV